MGSGEGDLVWRLTVGGGPRRRPLAAGPGGEESGTWRVIVFAVE